MTEVTRILSAIEQGDSCAAEQLLPLVYDELRKLAAQRLAQEKQGQTLQATALVHEAYLRLVDTDREEHWNSRGHFFAAAAEAMRRILVEAARHKRSRKRGGGMVRHEIADVQLAAPALNEEILALDEALARLTAKDPIKAQLVTLRHFAGLTIEETAQALGISVTTANRYWAYARAWLHQEILANQSGDPEGASSPKKNMKLGGTIPSRISHWIAEATIAADSGPGFQSLVESSNDRRDALRRRA
jgi:RNA polymerase sigma factor (TIGR02999 family)